MALNIYRQTRDRIAEIAGKPITQQEFGEALGLGKADAARSVRAWEAADAKPPRGLAAIGLDYLRQGLTDDLPLHMGGGAAQDSDGSYVHRCRWPRFVARVVGRDEEPAEGEVAARIGDGDHRLVVCSWIDTTMFGIEPQALVDSAAAWVASVTRRYDRAPSEEPAEELAASEAD